eukprot:scpid64338/ scgid4073/ 
MVSWQEFKKFAPFLYVVIIGSLLATNVIMFFWGFDYTYLDRHTAPRKWCNSYCGDGVQPILKDTQTCPPVYLLDEPADTVDVQLDTTNAGIVDNASVFPSKFFAVQLAICSFWVIVSLVKHDLDLYRHAKLLYLLYRMSLSTADLKVKLDGRTRMLNLILFSASLLALSLWIFGGLFLYLGLHHGIVAQSRRYPHVDSQCQCYCGYYLSWFVAAKLVIYLLLNSAILGNLALTIQRIKDTPSFIMYKHRVSIISLFHHKEFNGDCLDPLVFKTPVENMSGANYKCTCDHRYSEGTTAQSRRAGPA